MQANKIRYHQKSIMKFGLLEILTLLGSVGIFLYGMKLMSEGLQKAAGDKLRNILAMMTNNRIVGVLTGFFIQSTKREATFSKTNPFKKSGIPSDTE